MASKNFFKKIERSVSGAYKKSGLRNIYEKNKSTILNTGALLAASTIPGVAAAIPGSTLMAAGTAAGIGALQDKARKEKISEKARITAAEGARNQANTDLDELLNGITTGTPANLPPGVVTGQPVSVQNPTPSTPSPLPSGPVVTPEMILPNGGIVGGTGEAVKDQNRLLAEAELQKQMQLGEIGTSKAEREQMLQEYANLISQQQNRILDENAPALYEDLNTRGLLRSSELGNAMARERAKSAAILQEQIGLQGLQDREAILGEKSKTNDQYYQGRYGAIQRGMSLEDFVRQTNAARLTGQALAPIPQAAPSSKGGQAAMIGAGASVATALKGK